MKKTEVLLALLKERGHRRTPIRRALLDLFVDHEKPLAVTDLLTAFFAQGIRANKTTLYRELTFLEQQGILTTIRLNERQVRYELADDHSERHHHHIVCTSCDRVEDVQLPEDLIRQERYLESLTGFLIRHHALEFFGICRGCQKEQGVSLVTEARERQRTSKLISSLQPILP